MARNAMSDTPSITCVGLAARTVRLLSKSGHILTLPLCLRERWVPVPDTLRSMIVGVAGIGKKFLDSVSFFTSSNNLLVFSNLLVESLLKTNLVKAVKMASIQRKAAKDFSQTFPNETIKQWKEMVKEWERDSSRPDPYVSTERGMFF